MGNILITGSGSGIGLAAAAELASRGEAVFATVRSLARADRLRQVLAGTAAQSRIVEMDVTDPDSVDECVTRILAEAGHIDCVVNNAGTAAVGPLEFVSDQTMKRLIDTNLLGPFRVARAVLPGMRERRTGRIVNISSVAGHPRLGLRLWGAYAISKAALRAMSEELLKEVSEFGISVVLMEGGVGGATPLWEQVANDSREYGAQSSDYQRQDRIARAQIEAAMSQPADVVRTARAIADACTLPDVAFRFPPRAQRIRQECDALSDDDFALLAAGRPPAERNGAAPGLWLG